jgi:hypothetical protein
VLRLGLGLAARFEALAPVRLDSALRALGEAPACSFFTCFEGKGWTRRSSIGLNAGGSGWSSPAWSAAPMPMQIIAPATYRVTLRKSM